jgi:nitrogen-specific signal transduction histidine kinase
MEPDQSQYSGSLVEQFDNLRAGIREAAHEINNPLGVIRMALYFLQTTNPEGEKREHYFKVIEESLGRIDQILQHLKTLRENPATKLYGQPPEDQQEPRVDDVR